MSKLEKSNLSTFLWWYGIGLNSAVHNNTSVCKLEPLENTVYPPITNTSETMQWTTQNRKLKNVYSVIMTVIRYYSSLVV